MVQRRGRKLHKATGQTLRCHPEDPSCWGIRGLIGQNVVIKSYHAGPLDFVKEYAKTVDDGGLEISTGNARHDINVVMYSMNKRKRWLLPDLLAENICDEDFHSNASSRVVMVERYLASSDTDMAWKKSLPDCKAVYNSQSSKKHRSPGGRTYSYETDLRTDRAARNRREELKNRRLVRARTGVRIDVPCRRWRRHRPREPAMPELRYEIIHPRPCNQYRWNTGSMVSTNPWNTKPQRVAWTRAHHKDKYYEFQETVSVGKEVCEQTLHDVAAEVCTQSEDEHDENSSSNQDYAKVTLSSFIVKTQKRIFCNKKHKRMRCSLMKEEADVCRTLTRVNRASPQSVKKYGKGCAIHESRSELLTDCQRKNWESDASDSGFESDGQLPVEPPRDPTVSWIPLAPIPTGCIQPPTLREDFGSSYCEGRSVPRRFAIRVASDGSNRDDSVSATTVFVAEKGTCLGHQSCDRVNLRMRICCADILPDLLSLETDERMHWKEDCHSLVSLVDDIRRLLSIVARKRKLEKNMLASPRKPPVILNTIQSLLRWKFEFSTLDKVRTELEEEEVLCEQATVESTAADIIREAHCGICYEELTASNVGGEQGLALLQCGHWFCLDCWTQHLGSHVQLNRINIQCPAYKCHSLIDFTTALSLLPDSLVPVHLAHVQDHRVSSHQRWKWCPNAKCGRLAKVPALDPGVVREIGVPIPCECGVSWCSECLELSHWPSTCQQAFKHLKYIKESAADVKRSPTIKFVEVKHCPLCKEPMEKNGGCTHMTCRCGFDFCWDCLAPWVEHYTNEWEFKCPQTKESLEIVYLPRRRVHSIDYSNMAVENRKQTKHDVIRKRHNAALALAMRLYLRTNHSPPVPESWGLPTDQYMTDHAQHRWSMFWCGTPEDLSRFRGLTAWACHIAAFVAEVRALLEYVSVLVGRGPRSLRSGANGWQALISKLMYIASRIEELLDAGHASSLGELWRSLNLLLDRGKQSLQDITRIMPMIHRKMNRWSPRPKDDATQKKQVGHV